MKKQRGRPKKYLIRDYRKIKNTFILVKNIYRTSKWLNIPYSSTYRIINELKENENEKK